MNTRTTIILLVLFFAGLIGLWWADFARIPTERQRREAADRVLPDLVEVSPGDIRRVEITGASGGPLAFERRERDRWQMVAPTDVMADQTLIETLVRNLKMLRRLPGAEAIRGSPSKFGLDHPDRTVRLFGSTKARPIAALDVGKTVDHTRYVRPAGRDGIEVVDNRWLAAVDKPAVDWREKNLFTLASFEVEGLSVSGDDRDLLAKRTRGQWQLQRPFKALADNNKVDGLLADLIKLGVGDWPKGYVADDVRDMARYGLDKPRMTFELTPAPGAGPPQVLQVGNDVPDMRDRAYARRADQDDVVLVDTRTLQDLAKQPTALRSQKIADLDLTQVDAIEIQTKDADHLLVRGPDGWRVLKPSTGNADTQTIRTLLTRLNEAQTSEFFDPAKVPESGLDQPFWVVKVWQGSRAEPASGNASASEAPRGEPALTLRLGRHNVIAKAIYAQTEGDPTVLTLTDNLLEGLPGGPLAYRDKNLLGLSPRDVVRLTIVRDGTTYSLEAHGRPDDYAAWRMLKPVSGPADAEGVARLAVMLAGLRAESLVTDAPDDLKSFGLDDPVVSVTWQIRPPLQSGAGSKTEHDGTELSLHVGNAVLGKQGSRYARVSGNAMVFTVSSAALALLSAELHDRKVLAFAPDQATRLVLRWPGLMLAFRSKIKPYPAKPDWIPENRPNPPPDLMARVGPLVTALSALNALRFTQYQGPFPPATGLTPPLATLEVELSGAEGTRRLHLGNTASEGLRFATTSAGSDGPVFLLSEPDWGPWANPPARLADLPEDVFAP